MPRAIATTLNLCLLTYYTAILLCGPCLHMLPGQGHASVVSASTVTEAHDSVSVATTHESTSHCPICHFLEQAQERPGALEPVEELPGVPFVPRLAAPILPSPPFLFSRSRAPPSPTTTLS